MGPAGFARNRGGKRVADLRKSGISLEFSDPGQADLHHSRAASRSR